MCVCGNRSPESTKNRHIHVLLITAVLQEPLINYDTSKDVSFSCNGTVSAAAEQ